MLTRYFLSLNLWKSYSNTVDADFSKNGAKSKTNMHHQNQINPTAENRVF